MCTICARTRAANGTELSDDEARFVRFGATRSHFARSAFLHRDTSKEENTDEKKNQISIRGFSSGDRGPLKRVGNASAYYSGLVHWNRKWGKS
jgi:hypothetical protein